MKGPLLIAANHPNSFLDAIILASLFRSPIYSLARGDAFVGKFTNKILTSLNMLPVYRVSEGAKNLGNNYSTFESCQQLFAQKKIVLIFSEGRCTNEWRLRPLKKGTARLALKAWQDQIPLRVLPLGINYSSFRFFGKNVVLNFGNIISQNEVKSDLTNGSAIIEFNQKLKVQLQNLVFEINKNDANKLKKYFYIKPSFFKKVTLLVPAIFGFLLNAPLYFLIHLIVKNRAKDHYDSIMVGALFLFYPLYIIFITWIAFYVTKSLYSLLLIAFMPFSAWSYLQLKRQIP